MNRHPLTSRTTFGVLTLLFAQGLSASAHAKPRPYKKPAAPAQTKNSPAPTSPKAAKGKEEAEDKGSQDAAPQVIPKTRGVLFDFGLSLGSVAGKATRHAEPLAKAATVMTLGNLAAGYRFDHFYVGGSLSAGVGKPAQTGDYKHCGDELDCDVALLRYGLAARLYPMPGSRLEPWLGVGFGAEKFSASVSYDGDPLAVAIADGTEKLKLQLGLDLWTKSRSPVTVFLDYSLGEFDHVKANGSGGDVPGSERSSHHWILGGVSYGLML